MGRHDLDQNHNNKTIKYAYTYVYHWRFYFPWQKSAIFNYFYKCCKNIIQVYRKTIKKQKGKERK